ncbi:polysaccharide pyruvyl transferase family protein [Clostridium gasigenes]|uniref:polysaccharide pyruvyl transferase family protein n=1 Tax=Clostridium gasigenes TaxID=94869 RepID=UPI001C0E0A21|nr:polysaccharide pyruvyl transferase family protein [Clostridium gasigenes]MBU3108327.1 polysaccharide pyruvyl transferase family protein [Clostridium gasigenes]
MKVLYLGWIGANNIGDELMFDNFKKVIKNKYGDKCRVTPLFCPETYNDFDEYDLVCLGGGSILLEGFIAVLYRALEQGKRVMVWGSGYDDLLGNEFIKRLEDLYISPYIYSDSTEEKLNEIAKKADFFGVRGPLTYKILEKSNIDMTNIVISGDPGFLLESANINEIGTNIDFTKRDKVVGINMGTSYNRIYGGREDLVEVQLLKACNRLLETGYKLYIYAMWPTDLDLVLELYKKLPKSENVILDIFIHTGEELVSIMKNCVFTINFKLHGNVASAVAKVPFICLGYRLKAYDLVKSIECEELNIPTDSENIYEEIEKCILRIEKNKDEIISKIDKNITRYKDILTNCFK